MSRTISWISAARKNFDKFPREAQLQIVSALEIAAHGEKADIAKPLRGLGSGIFEVALAHRGDAHRTVYAVQIDDDFWVIHAFQKKSTRGTALLIFCSSWMLP